MKALYTPLLAELTPDSAYSTTPTTEPVCLPPLFARQTFNRVPPSHSRYSASLEAQLSAGQRHDGARPPQGTKEMMQPCLNLVHPLHDISLVPRGHRKVRFGAVNFVIRSSDDPRLAAEQISDGTMCAGPAWSKPQMWDTI